MRYGGEGQAPHLVVIRVPRAQGYSCGQMELVVTQS